MEMIDHAGAPSDDHTLRNSDGQIIGTKPRPRPVRTCACGNHAFADLTRWAVVLVSPQDAPLLTQRAWHLVECDGGCSYAFGRVNGQHVALHRLIAGTPADLDTDHRNRNGLDNRRANLRDATRSENNRNRRAVRSVSGFFGVALHRHSGLWRGYVKHNGRQVSAGYFHNAATAAAARDDLCRSLGLSTARINFPQKESER